MVDIKDQNTVLFERSEHPPCVQELREYGHVWCHVFRGNEKERGTKMKRTSLKSPTSRIIASQSFLPIFETAHLKSLPIICPTKPSSKYVFLGQLIKSLVTGSKKKLNIIIIIKKMISKEILPLPAFKTQPSDKYLN